VRTEKDESVNDDLHTLPNDVRLPYKYRRSPELRPWFIDGARDGAAGRAFRHNAEAEFVRLHGQSAFTAYAEGYNEGQATRNTDR